MRGVWALLRLNKSFCCSSCAGRDAQALLPTVHKRTITCSRIMARRGRGPAAADDEHAAVVAAVRMLLPQTDMSTTTERDVREMVQRELRLESVEQHKAVIKAEVDAFLTSVVERQQPHPQHNDSGGNARKRAPSHQAAPGAPRAKNARRKSHEDEDGDEDSDDDVDDGGGSDDDAARAELPAGAHALDAAGLKLVRLSDFKGRHGVDVRTFYRDRNSAALAPTKRGVCFNAAEWTALAAALPRLVNALRDEAEGTMEQLTPSLRATVSLFNGRMQLDVREYYADDQGEQRPGRRGAALALAEAERLLALSPGLSQELAAVAPAPVKARPRSDQAQASQPASKRSSTGGTGTGAGGSSSSAAAAPLVVQLGARKRAAVSTLTGTACVDLRETYEKDGEMLPGKKGIMLRSDQWTSLTAAASDVTAALTAHDGSYKHDLGSRRLLTVSEFKGSWYVGVREYYEKGGQLAPGIKGLNMTAAEWTALQAGMQALTDALGAER